MGLSQALVKVWGLGFRVQVRIEGVGFRVMG